MEVARYGGDLQNRDALREESRGATIRVLRLFICQKIGKPKGNTRDKNFCMVHNKDAARFFAAQTNERIFRKMDFINARLRRMRRRNRFPGRIFAAVALSVLLFTLTVSLLILPASAKNKMRMPRTDDGIVTDEDGIIGSGDATSDMIPEIGDSVSEGIDNMLPSLSTDGSSRETAPVTQAPGAGTTNVPESSGAMDENGAVGNTIAWIIGLVVLAGVVIAIVLIIRWASGNRRDR